MKLLPTHEVRRLGGAIAVAVAGMRDEAGLPLALGRKMRLRDWPAIAREAIRNIERAERHKKR